MKVRMLVSMAGDSGRRIAGAVITVDKKEAKRLLDAGYATAVRSPKKAEKAVAE